MPAEPQGAVDEDRPGAAERRGEQFDDPVEHHRHVEGIDSFTCGTDARPDVVLRDLVPRVPVLCARVLCVPVLCGLVRGAVPVGSLVLPVVPHALLFLHALAVSP
ncbi:hypothetical protein GCM10009642_45230 [Nocardiopsis metallicus]